MRLLQQCHWAAWPSHRDRACASMQEVASLHAKDTALQAATAARKAVIARNAEAIVATRVAVERTAREWRADSAALADEIGALAPHFNTLKSQRIKARRLHERDMRNLSISMCACAGCGSAGAAGPPQLLRCMHFPAARCWHLGHVRIAAEVLSCCWPCRAKTEELLNTKLAKAQTILALSDLCKKYEMDYEHLATRRDVAEFPALPGGQVRAPCIPASAQH